MLSEKSKKDVTNYYGTLSLLVLVRINSEENVFFLEILEEKRKRNKGRKLVQKIERLNYEYKQELI